VRKVRTGWYVNVSFPLENELIYQSSGIHPTQYRESMGFLTVTKSKSFKTKLVEKIVNQITAILVSLEGL